MFSYSHSHALILIPILSYSHSYALILTFLCSRNPIPVLSQVSLTALTVIEFFVSGFAVVAVFGLACYHTQLIATMKTTNEEVIETLCTCAVVCSVCEALYSIQV